MPSPRDRAIALVPVYAGARIAEIVGLDVDDIRLSARKGALRICGKGEEVREIPIHHQLRATITGWPDERPDWPGAESPALFLNQRGGRLSVKGAHDIIAAITKAAGLEDDTTTHVLRHTFATRLVRGRTDLVIVAELLGHARFKTARAYSRPTHQDAINALELEAVDRAAADPARRSHDAVALARLVAHARGGHRRADHVERALVAEQLQALQGGHPRAGGDRLRGVGRHVTVLRDDGLELRSGLYVAAFAHHQRSGRTTRWMGGMGSSSGVGAGMCR